MASCSVPEKMRCEWFSPRKVLDFSIWAIHVYPPYFLPYSTWVVVLISVSAPQSWAYSVLNCDRVNNYSINSRSFRTQWFEAWSPSTHPMLTAICSLWLTFVASSAMTGKNFALLMSSRSFCNRLNSRSVIYSLRMTGEKYFHSLIHPFNHGFSSLLSFRSWRLPSKLSWPLIANPCLSRNISRKMITLVADLGALSALPLPV